MITGRAVLIPYIEGRSQDDSYLIDIGIRLPKNKAADEGQKTCRAEDHRRARHTHCARSSASRRPSPAKAAAKPRLSQRIARFDDRIASRAPAAKIP